MVASYAASWNALKPAGAGRASNKAFIVSLEEQDKEQDCAL